VNYEDQTIEMHIIGRGMQTFKVSELTNEELEDLWYNANNETARFALRERKGIDPTWTVSTMKKSDIEWMMDWKKRQRAAAELEAND
jgi:hypothetical protein